MEGSKVINLELAVKSLFEQMKEHSYYLGEALKSDPKLTESVSYTHLTLSTTPYV